MADFRSGDRVTITDGNSAGRSGAVIHSRESNYFKFVVVEIILFNRAVPVELKPWQIVAESTHS
jgi:transcription antitermination factor NusG